MANKLTWVFELVDRLSNPATRIARSLHAVEHASAQFGQRTQLPNVARDGDRAGQAWAGFLTDLNAGVDLAERFAGAMVGAAEAVARVGAEAIQFVVRQAAFQQGTMTTLRTLLRSDRAARAEFAQSLAVAQATPFDTGDVVRARSHLVTAGFGRAHDRDVLFAGLSDLAAMNPNDSSVLERATVAISQIHAAGQLRGQEMLQLENAGLSRGRVFEALAPMLRLHGDQRSVVRQVQEAMRTGRVTGDMAIRAVVEAIRRQAGGGRLGSLTRAQSGTLNGLLSNLRSLPGDLLQRFDFEHLPAMERFRGFLRDVLGLFQRGNPIGERFLEAVKAIIGDLFVLFDISPGRLGDTVDGITHGLQIIHRALPGIVRGVREFVFSFGHGFMAAAGPALERFASLLGMTGELGSTAGNVLGRLAGSFLSLALTLLTRVLPALDDLFSGAPGGMRRLGHELGAALFDGFLDGMRDMLPSAVVNGADMLRSAADQITQTLFGSDDASNSLTPRPGSTGPGMFPGEVRASASTLGQRPALSTGPITVHVNVPPGTTDPQTIGEHLAQTTNATISAALERYALAHGGA